MPKFCEACEAHKEKACQEDLFSSISFDDGDAIACSKSNSSDLIYKTSKTIFLIEHKIREWFLCFYRNIDEDRQQKKIKVIQRKIESTLSLIEVGTRKVLFLLLFSKKIQLPIFPTDDEGAKQAKQNVNRNIAIMDESFLKIYIKTRLFSQMAPNDGLHAVTKDGKIVYLFTGECKEFSYFFRDL